MPTEATRLVLYADLPLHAALFKDAANHGRDLNDHILRILGEHAVEKGLFGKEDSEEYRLHWSLIDRAAQAARRICREGGFDEHITRNAIEACMADSGYAADYEAYIRGNPYAHGNPRKAVNKEIGRSIKTAIGAQVLRNEDGAPAKENVSGSVIQSYTKMISFDPAVVG
jgi:hypothetical protein